MKPIIAWIGTGVMGGPMARHLSTVAEVHVYNRTHAKALALEPDCHAYQNLADCVRDASIVFSMVGMPKDVTDIYETIMRSVAPGTILVDCTTSSPSQAVQLAHKAEAQGLTMLDAPVSGGDIGAKNGTLSVMVGGDQQAYEKILPFLQTFATSITYMGPAGSGQHTKMANQIAIAGAMSGVAEALAYAKLHKIDLDTLIHVLSGGAAASWQLSNNGPKMVQEDYAPGFFNKHFLKDLDLARKEAAPLDLPVLDIVDQMVRELVDAGDGDLGTQSLFKHYQSIK